MKTLLLTIFLTFSTISLSQRSEIIPIYGTYTIEYSQITDIDFQSSKKSEILDLSNSNEDISKSIQDEWDMLRVLFFHYIYTRSLKYYIT